MDEKKTIIFSGKIKNTESIKDFNPPLFELIKDPSLLAEISTFSLINYLSNLKWTGLVEFKKDGEITKVYFIAGGIVTIEKPESEIEDELCKKLVNDKYLSKDIVESAKQKAEETSKSISQILYEEGYVTPRILVEIIKTIKENRLTELFLLKEATYATIEKAQSGKKIDPIRIEPQIFLAKFIREKLNKVFWTEIEDNLKNYMGRFPIKKQGIPPFLESTILSEKERKVLNEIVDGSVTLKEVFGLSLLSRNATARLFFILIHFGLIDFRMTPLPKGGIEIFEKKLEEIYERMVKEDFFIRLQVHWSVHPNKIEDAFMEMTKKYGPLSESRTFSEKCAELCDKIYALILEAYEVLKDKTTRREYREKLLGFTKLKFGAEFLYKQANLILFKGDMEKAKMLIESAIDILPLDEYLEFRRKI